MKDSPGGRYMRDHRDRQRPAWPLDSRLAMSDLFEMIEAFENDPRGYSPEMRDTLSNDPYGQRHAAQTHDRIAPRIDGFTA